jgi:CHAT domain
MPGFALDWFAGASAQLELARSSPSASDQYRLRYVSPFRPTIRVPSPGQPLIGADLQLIQKDLDGVFASVVGRSAPRAGTATGTTTPESDLVDIGGTLFPLVLPGPIEADLRPMPLFLDLGVDQRLVAFPWELMHDGREFLCLRHYVGRFVNVDDAGSALAARATTWLGTPIDKLSVLLISVPQPDERPGAGDTPAIRYERLPGAWQEATDVLSVLTGILDVSVTAIRDEEATIRRVIKELRSGKHHIIHFSGHATTSGLVLHDHDMSATMLRKFAGATAPILCFINGCDSGKTTAWTDNYDMFELARAFLETGSYLLGIRWKL